MHCSNGRLIAIGGSEIKGHQSVSVVSPKRRLWRNSIWQKPAWLPIRLDHGRSTPLTLHYYLYCYRIINLIFLFFLQFFLSSGDEDDEGDDDDDDDEDLRHHHRPHYYYLRNPILTPNRFHKKWKMKCNNKKKIRQQTVGERRPYRRRRVEWKMKYTKYRIIAVWLCGVLSCAALHCVGRCPLPCNALPCFAWPLYGYQRLSLSNLNAGYFIQTGCRCVELVAC